MLVPVQIVCKLLVAETDVGAQAIYPNVSSFMETADKLFVVKLSVVLMVVLCCRYHLLGIKIFSFRFASIKPFNSASE